MDDHPQADQTNEKPPQKPTGAPPPPSQPKATPAGRSRSFSRSMTPRRSGPNPYIRWGQRGFRLIALVFGSVFHVVARFFRGAGRREFRHLLQGLPALLMFGGVIYASVMVSLHRGEVLPNYKVLANEASQAEKYESALLYYRKLMKLDGGSFESQYAYAKVLDAVANQKIASGDKLRKDDEQAAKKLIAKGQSLKLDAISTIQQIAPQDSQGYPPAHLHQARLMLANPVDYKLVDADGQILPQGRRVIEHHLDSANITLAGTLELEMAYFSYLMGTKRPDEAIEHLEELAELKPHFNYDLMQLHLKMKQLEKARLRHKLASDYYERLIEENPDNQVAIARCANLRLIGGDFSGCLRLLEESLARRDPDQDGNPYPALLASSHVKIYDVLMSTKSASIETGLTHLREALDHVPDFQPALSRLARLVSLPGEAGEQIETMLNRMIAKGSDDKRVSATAHFALGTKAWKENDSETALWHLERAYELDEGQTLGSVGNNLAWMLAEQDPPDLQLALQIIDSVIEKFPDIPTFHDTKGYILVKKGDWQAALHELETALPHMRDNIDTHQSLMKVYQELGRQELAAEHERIIQELEKADRIRRESRAAADQFAPATLPATDSGEESPVDQQ